MDEKLFFMLLINLKLIKLGTSLDTVHQDSSTDRPTDRPTDPKTIIMQRNNSNLLRITTRAKNSELCWSKNPLVWNSQVQDWVLD